MPLLDHFHPPLNKKRPWTGIHSAWANRIAEQLNESILPSNYVAIPQAQLGAGVEIDIATLKEPYLQLSTRPTASTWSPTQPVWSVPVQWEQQDIFEVRVFREDENPTLVAAVELVSRANKDRPANRQAFAGKCAGFLRQGVGVLVVDVVTDRQNSLHEELTALLELNGSATFSAPLYAVSYRTAEVDGLNRLDIWPETLSIGQSLPTMPLWLAVDFAVPVDLESSYLAACRGLRIF